MFTVLLQRADGRERMIDGDEIEYDRSAQTLTINGEAHLLYKGDNVFVMNGEGQTVRRYRG
jgi:phage baseplate assembly protein gpV